MPTDKQIRRAVKDGGGEYVGIQGGHPTLGDMVLFNSPATGSTLALPIQTVCLPGRVEMKIFVSDANFKLAKEKVR